MDTSFGASRPRQRRSARARREQKARAAARVISHLVKASTVLAGHRGCQQGHHLTDLAHLLAKPLVTGDPDDFAPSACSPYYDDEDIPLGAFLLGAFLPPEPPAVPLGPIIRAFLPPDFQEGLVQDLPAPHDHALDADPYDDYEDIPLGAFLPPEPPEVFLGPIIRAFLSPAPPEEGRWRQVHPPPFLRGLPR